MAKCGVSLSPITALHELQHLFFAFFQLRSSSIFERIVKGEGVTALVWCESTKIDGNGSFD